jgi:hypothetical protein
LTVSLLFSLVFRSVCRGWHQRLAGDALRFVRGPEAERWSDLFLSRHREYLAGTAAPDERFKDFRNHVLHVAENWGGAPAEARRWYGRAVDAIRRREWDEAIFAAGALSHYFSDPFLPLHTAQCEEQTRVHRAVDWSLDRSYGRMQQIIARDRGGYPQLEAPRTDAWLERMICTGAELAGEHYQTVLDHYDLQRAVRDPLAGMDQQCQDAIALCLSHAVVGLARVLERMQAEAEVEPPPVETTLQGFVLLLNVPFRWVWHYAGDLSEQMAIEATCDEVQRTGKVVKNLPDEEREIRRLHAEEVLRLPLHQLDHRPAGLTGTLYGSGCQERYVPNRFITAPVLSMPGETSLAWREAQLRAVARRAGGVSLPMRSTGDRCAVISGS